MLSSGSAAGRFAAAWFTYLDFPDDARCPAKHRPSPRCVNATATVDPVTVDLAEASVRDLNQRLHDLDDDGRVQLEGYVQTLTKLGDHFVQAQAEGACDEGCDTRLPAKKSSKRDAKERRHPVDAYPGARFDRVRKRWGHHQDHQHEL